MPLLPKYWRLVGIVLALNGLTLVVLSFAHLAPKEQGKFLLLGLGWMLLWFGFFVGELAYRSEPEDIGSTSLEPGGEPDTQEESS